MKVKQTPINGMVIVESEYRRDHRGSFARLYCDEQLNNLIGARKVVQINHSITNSVGAIRGLHYQRAPNTEMKMVRCLKGKVWDVAVDLRKESSSFLQWYGLELTPDNANMIVIPEGCAHGFQVIEPDSELLYLHTNYYNPEVEGGIAFDDPRLEIDWPLPAVDLSERDKSHAYISSNYSGIEV